ncbi:zinc-finger domain-containing protein [Georgfuchsia toluolica]|uniref:zinc-finger domain-containing protein n=1 Tax=Georgfuchsia toluolica TaxID=424218 RepID=UPI001C738B3D|nr:zinc-finger domain-containing protein [Georgfuchsia toluolica]
MTQTNQASDTSRAVDVTAHDLPLHCPLPGAPLWARHPRVFLDVLKSGSAACPYCGTRYTFTGERPHGHH